MVTATRVRAFPKPQMNFPNICSQILSAIYGAKPTMLMILPSFIVPMRPRAGCETNLPTAQLPHNIPKIEPSLTKLAMSPGLLIAS